jgi:hypothetical protein
MVQLALIRLKTKLNLSQNVATETNAVQTMLQGSRRTKTSVNLGVTSNSSGVD